MRTSQPMAPRSLVLLTVGVLAVHWLLLQRFADQEPLRPPVLRALVTRVLVAARPEAEAGAADPVQEPAMEVVRRAPRSSFASATPQSAVPQAESVAVGASMDTPQAQSVAVGAQASPAHSPSPTMRIAVPASVRLRYAVSGQSRRQPWSAEGELLWRHDGNEYEAKLEYSAPLVPARTHHSTGRITAEGLAPLRFSDKRRGERATHFEREAGMLVFSANAAPVALLPGVQDRLSVLLQLASMLAAEPAKFPTGSQVSLQTAGTRDAQAWLFAVEADEMLQLPGGNVATRKLVRGPRHEYDIRMEVWLAPGMDYVPVRIRLTQPNGDYVDQQWSSTDRS